MTIYLKHNVLKLIIQYYYYINAYVDNSNVDSFCSLEISNITVEYWFKFEVVLKHSKIPLYTRRSSTKIYIKIRYFRLYF